MTPATVLERVTPDPEFVVLDSEYRRLLGFPRDYEMAGHARNLADEARRWYAAHSAPWWYARYEPEVSVGDDGVRIGGTQFSASELRETMRQARADAVVLVAVSAGIDCEEEARRRWDEGKPDEYFFLEVFGSAVVEALVSAAAFHLCASAEQHGLAVLPHDSPGYPGWEIDEQQALLALIDRGEAYECQDRLVALHTGMLRPKKSLLAVFGVTHHTDRVRRLTALTPCERCSLARCRYRRAPYRRPLPSVGATPAIGGSVAPAREGPPEGSETVRTRDASYAVSRTALERWSQERLQLNVRPGRSVEACVRYDGTTCSNMGRRLAFDHHLRLSPPEDGLRITEARCVPAPGDTGHAFMCEYRTRGESLLSTIAADAPLLGRRLDDVLRWERDSRPAGCYCEPAAREHKWGLVLEVLHYALARSLAGEKARNRPSGEG